MQNREIQFRVIIAATSLLLANTACAFDMGDMMNPSKWTGGDKDRDRYDDYGPGYGYPGGYPGYGYGGGPGYGGYPGYGGDPGYGYGGGPGYGGYPGYGGDPGYGYGGDPGYGYGGAPGYGYGGAPGYGAQGTESNEAEIKRLKARLRQLESGPK